MELWKPRTSAFGEENERVKMYKCISLLPLLSLPPWMKTVDLEDFVGPWKREGCSCLTQSRLTRFLDASILALLRRKSEQIRI